MQKAREPENDAGFPKHNYSQLNCSCYSYPLSLYNYIDYRVFLGCTSTMYVISKCLLTQLTSTLTAIAHVSHMCTPRALVMY